MPIGAYYPSKEEKLKREASQNPESPRGMSHYPQHIVAQAEAQRAQQQAIQQAQQQAQQSGQAQVQQPQQAPPAQKPQPAQQGLTQIVLPPPTTSETLNIQEYQPPAPERRTTRQSIANSNAARTASQSPAPGGRGARPTSRSPSVHQTRSNSRTQPQHSPYLANANAPASTATPPPVPATFASIMNAYPAPTAAGNSASPKNSNE
ncbi:hypothetical protein BD779DRAFT_742650 [Infundibulicybe gibba]|nr:hypothetical protein BD779DRAFT_742650 [Infundibulicybe gibba]